MFCNLFFYVFFSIIYAIGILYEKGVSRMKKVCPDSRTTFYIRCLDFIKKKIL